MNKKLDKIKKILEFELESNDFLVIEEPTYEMVEVYKIVNFSIENDKLGVTFYSGVHPTEVAFYIRMLQRHKVPNDYIIFETMYPKLNEKEEFVDMLFGDDADEECKQSIFREQYKKLYLAHNAMTFGPKQ